MQTVSIGNLFQNLFPRKNRINIINVLPAELAQRVVRVYLDSFQKKKQMSSPVWFNNLICIFFFLCM